MPESPQLSSACSRRSTIPTGAERSGERRGGYLGRLVRHDLSATTNRSAMRSLWGVHDKMSEFCFLRADRSWSALWKTSKVPPTG